MCLTRCCADPTPWSHSQFGVLTYPSLLPWSNNSAQTVLLINVSLWSTQSPNDSQGGPGPPALGTPLSTQFNESNFLWIFHKLPPSVVYERSSEQKSKPFGRSANSLHAQCKCRHLPIARIPWLSCRSLVLGMRPYTQDKARLLSTGSGWGSSASHPPFPLASACPACFHRETGRDVYILSWAQPQLPQAHSHLLRLRPGSLPRLNTPQHPRTITSHTLAGL